MSSMLKSLSAMMIASSIAIASGDSDVINFVKSKLNRNPNVKINSVKVIDKYPIPDTKDWSAYLISLDINISRGKKSRHINVEDILYVSKDFITSELVDRKTGRSARSKIQPKLPKDIYSRDNLIYGNENAPHKLVLFSDPLCPFCRMFVPKVLEAVKNNPNEMALYYYHLPLSIHPAAETLVRIMEVAQKEGKSDIVDKIYNIKIDARLKDEKKILEIVAEQIGYKLSIKQIHEPWIDERVKRDRLMARKLLVSGTPTIYVDGKKDVTREKYKEFMKKK